MQIRLLVPLAASAILAGCGTFSASNSASSMDCPSGLEAADGYVIGGDGTIAVSGIKDLIHSGTWSAENAFHECEGVMPEPEPEPEPEAEPETKAEPTPVEINVPVKFDARTLFKTDSADLGSSGLAALDSLAAGIEGLSQVRRVVVVGHADSTGTEAYNQALSERRAASVASYLTTKLTGLDVASVGRGERKPIATNDTALGRAKNRRVEVVVIGTKTEMQ